MNGRVILVAPFDPGKFPPFINTVRVALSRGAHVSVVASHPIQFPELFRGCDVLAPTQTRHGAVQLSFLIGRVAWLSRRYPRSVVIGHNTRGAFAAAVGTRGTRVSVVYHCHDFEHGPGSDRLRLLPRLERVAFRYSHEVWVPAPERAEIARRLGYRGPISIVKNCPALVSNLPARGTLRKWLAQTTRHSPSAPLVVRHGGIGLAHYIEETIRALPSLPPETLFVLIAPNDAELVARYKAFAQRHGVAARLVFHPFVPHDRLLALLVDADIGMAVYSPANLNEQSPAPNKAFEFMSAGVPIVVASGNSLAIDVEAAGAGLTVGPGDHPALVDTMCRLLNDGALRVQCAARGRAAHLAMFNYERQLESTSLGRMLPDLPQERDLQRIP